MHVAVPRTVNGVGRGGARVGDGRAGGAGRRSPSLLAWSAITGAVLSATVTLNVVGTALLPATSFAVQVTVVSPSAN